MPSVHDRFNLVSDFELAGDQPRAIGELVDGLNRGDRHQVLLGVTGSGKTFTMAQAIARVNRPALVMVHNKTLAAQLFQEFRRFFPKNDGSWRKIDIKIARPDAKDLRIRARRGYYAAKRP